MFGQEFAPSPPLFLPPPTHRSTSIPNTKGGNLDGWFHRKYWQQTPVLTGYSWFIKYYKNFFLIPPPQPTQTTWIMVGVRNTTWKCVWLQWIVLMYSCIQPNPFSWKLYDNGCYMLNWKNTKHSCSFAWNGTIHRNLQLCNVCFFGLQIYYLS